MRLLLLLITLAMAASLLVTASPLDPKHWLINRPKEPQYQRIRRSEPYAKGGAPAKGRVPLTRQPALRKGEYACGNKICQLQPGEIPKGCNGICQYPLPLVKK